ncbi:head-tail connector protein [Methylorubrum zatmanii]
MIPIRVEESGVEPVSLTEMRTYLRLSSDETAEDALIGRLIVAARGAVEAASRRLLRPARFRVVLTDWPPLGLLPLPLSPLVAVTRAALVDESGAVTDIAPGPIRLGPDVWEAPCLLLGPDLPPLGTRTALIEVVAGCGGDGPPVPEPLLQALCLAVADGFENRGDTVGAGAALPPSALGLAAACRRMRL